MYALGIHRSVFIIYCMSMTSDPAFRTKQHLSRNLSHLAFSAFSHDQAWWRALGGTAPLLNRITRRSVFLGSGRDAGKICGRGRGDGEIGETRGRRSGKNSDSTLAMFWNALKHQGCTKCKCHCCDVLYFPPSHAAAVPSKTC